MISEIPGSTPTQGVTSHGVPFIALAPENGHQAKALVVAWHGADPPRTEQALAAALPLRTLPAWRVYLGMPGHGQRSPAGGVDEIMRLAAEDALTLLFRPRIEGAVAELRGAVDELRDRLAIPPQLPMGVFGFSQGGAAALLALSRRVLAFKAAVTFGAIIDMRAMIDAAAASFGMAYEWTGPRTALAEELSTLHRAGAIAQTGAAILLAYGAEDPLPTREPAERLAAAIRGEGGTAESQSLSNLGHAFVEEPGEAPVPQGAAARAIDEAATGWFVRHLM